MEANEIAVQDTFQNLIPHRQNTVDFTTGKWSMEEEAQLDILLGVADCLSKHSRK